MLDFKSLLNPMSIDEFKEKYYRKKFCIIKGNSFRKYMFGNVISWRRFSEYINNDRAVSGLQCVTEGGHKFCMEKNNLYLEKKPNWSKKDYYDKAYVNEIWNNNGSIILTKASELTTGISEIAGAIENELGGAADAHFYCSKGIKSCSFNAHADLDDNFLIHCYGSVKWVVSNTLENIKEDSSEFNLTVGDMLYIPKKLMHQAFPLSKRISISVPLLEGKQIVPINRTKYFF